MALAELALSQGVVLALASLASLISQRAGMLNLGLEGVFALAAYTAYTTTLSTGNPLIAVLIAVITAVPFNMLFAILTVEFRLNHIVVGMALTLIGIGLAYTLGHSMVGAALRPIIMPCISLFRIRLDISVILTTALTALIYLMLTRTRFGYEIRAVGEDPYVADSMGISIRRVRYMTTLIEGVLTALSASYFILHVQPQWTDGVTLGWGWLAIITAMAGVWNPIYTTILSFLIAGLSLIRFAIQMPILASYLAYSIPYVTTIAVLAIISKLQIMRKRIEIPRALAKIYSREERGGEYV